MIIYIAGAISGQLEYRKKFRKIENQLKRKGHVVINPALLPPGLKSHNDYMHICYACIDVADAVYLLDNWIYSKGAQLEKAYAKTKQKRVIQNKELEMYIEGKGTE